MVKYYIRPVTTTVGSYTFNFEAYSVRRLEQYGLQARRPVRGVPLTAAYCRHRLSWCRKHINWTSTQSGVTFLPTNPGFEWNQISSCLETESTRNPLQPRKYPLTAKLCSAFGCLFVQSVIILNLLHLRMTTVGSYEYNSTLMLFDIYQRIQVLNAIIFRRVW